jgi:DHA1 family bicyclomycin/chloramphenicol resistance-like MFS transporter
MTHLIFPPLWLMVLIAGLPQLSETVYTPSLPEIAMTLQASETWVEYTLTVYLYAFAWGILFWGKISDQYGRKPCVIGGQIIFLIGCVGCYYSKSIEMLMLSRFIQGFGGSIGSVLSHAMCRDVFKGPEIGKVYSVLSTALAVFPAIGPVIGGFIAQYYHWSNIFIFLIGFALITQLSSIFFLTETHPIQNRKSVKIKPLLLRMIKDKKLIILAMLHAGCNGIYFSYFAEGSFYLIEQLGLTPSQYGESFLLLSLATMVGGIMSKRMNETHQSHQIIGRGLHIVLWGNLFFALFIMSSYFIGMPKLVLASITVLSQMVVLMGSCMISSNVLAIALMDYRESTGTASSLFGFFYYSITSWWTMGMGFFHNGTLIPMPLYFLGITIVLLILFNQYKKKYVNN